MGSKRNKSRGLDHLRQLQGKEISRRDQANTHGGKERRHQIFLERIKNACGGIIKQ